MIRKKAISALCVAILLLTTGAGAAQASGVSNPEATGDSGDDAPIRTFRLPTSAGAGAQLPNVHSTRVAQEDHRTLGKAKKALGRAFNAAELDERTGQIVVHVGGVLDQGKKDQVSNAMRSTPWRLAVDTFSRADIEEEAWSIATSGRKVNGRSILGAGPNADSSAIQLVLEGAAHEGRESHAAGKISKYPVEVTFAQAPKQASREYDPEPPHWGGAQMNRPGDPGYRVYCTTGFGVGYMSGSSLVTEHLTADHCGPTGSEWRTGPYANSAILGIMKDTRAVGADLKRMTGAQWGPVVYGGPVGSSSGIGIKGAVTPMLNDMYCYSGSQSGIVCGNKVTSMNQTVCYGIPGPCYRNQVYTDQVDGLPASGQGDSGGPVLAERNGYAYAAGIVSGMWNYSSQCTGYGERLCSSHNITAPIEAFFQENPGYGILVY